MRHRATKLIEARCAHDLGPRNNPMNLPAASLGSIREDDTVQAQTPHLSAVREHEAVPEHEAVLEVEAVQEVKASRGRCRLAATFDWIKKDFKP
jgi:hypothetical protein